jgi:hypothetical protein
MKYYYYINLNERGEFFADVRDANDKTIFEIQGFSIFEDGHMQHAKDIEGLRDHLIELNIIDPDDHIETGD